jgi:hypothetical protein
MCGDNVLTGTLLGVDVPEYAHPQYKKTMINNTVLIIESPESLRFTEGRR